MGVTRPTPTDVLSELLLSDLLFTFNPSSACRFYLYAGSTCCILHSTLSHYLISHYAGCH